MARIYSIVWKFKVCQKIAQPSQHSPFWAPRIKETDLLVQSVGSCLAGGTATESGPDYIFTAKDTRGLELPLASKYINESHKDMRLKSFIIFTNPSARVRYDTRSIFKRSLTGLNSEFSFSQTSCLTKAEEPSLPYYLPIAGGRIVGFIPFPRALVLCEMQSVSSKIWTRVAVD